MINKKIIPSQGNQLNNYNLYMKDNYNSEQINQRSKQFIQQKNQSTQLRQTRNDKKLSYNFTVAVRVKPKVSDTQKTNNTNLLNYSDVGDQTLIMEYPHNAQQSYTYSSKNRKFTFDSVFIDRDNRFIYQNLIKNKLDVLTENMNLTLLTYGITGSGKTHTIFGNKQMKEQGLAMMVFADVIKNYKNGIQNRNSYEKKLCQNKNEAGNVKFMFSYMQIYNQQVHDLLKRQTNTGSDDIQLIQSSPQLKLKSLNILEDSNGRVNIPQLTKIPIDSTQMICQLIQKGNLIRACSSNMINKLSSRSHAILQLYCMDTQTKIENIVTIIDLAGSQRHISTNFGHTLRQKSKQKDNHNLQKQGSNINKSLLALANCLKGLQNGQTHIPYRDSKLTRILKEDLSGKSHNIMIACVGRSMSQADQTVNTLQYASRAANIKVEKLKNTSKNDAFECAYCYKLTPWRNIIQKLPEQILFDQNIKKITRPSFSLHWNKNLQKQNLPIIKKQQSSQVKFQIDLSQILVKLKKDIIDLFSSQNSYLESDRQQLFRDENQSVDNLIPNICRKNKKNNFQLGITEVIEKFQMNIDIILEDQLQRYIQRYQQIHSYTKTEIQQKEDQIRINYDSKNIQQGKKIIRALSEDQKKLRKITQNKDKQFTQYTLELLSEMINRQKQKQSQTQKQMKLFNLEYFKNKNLKKSVSSSSSSQKYKQKQKNKNKNNINLSETQIYNSWEQRQKNQYKSNIRKKINITNNKNHIFCTTHSGGSTVYSSNNSYCVNKNHDSRNKIKTQRMNPDVDIQPEGQSNNRYKNLIIKKIEQAKKDIHSSQLEFFHQNCSKIEFQNQNQNQTQKNQNINSDLQSRDQIKRKKKHSKTYNYAPVQTQIYRNKSNKGQCIKVCDKFNGYSDIQISSFREDSSLNSNSQNKLQIDTSIGFF